MSSLWLVGRTAKGRDSGASSVQPRCGASTVQGLSPRPGVGRAWSPSCPWLDAASPLAVVTSLGALGPLVHYLLRQDAPS